MFILVVGFLGFFSWRLMENMLCGDMTAMIQNDARVAIEKGDAKGADEAFDRGLSFVRTNARKTGLNKGLELTILKDHADYLRTQKRTQEAFALDADYKRVQDEMRWPF